MRLAGRRPTFTAVALMLTTRLTIFIFVIVVATSVPLHVRADELSPTKKQVDFVAEIEPILRDHCVSCHGADVQEGQLRLDARAAVKRGGVNGPVLIAGKSDTSLLIQRVVDDKAGDRMPLDEEPLSAQQIATLRRWIDAGAKWPDGVGAEVESIETHWAYVPPTRTKIQANDVDASAQNLIDVFVRRKLRARKLEPSPSADRARLLRRVYLDLIGVPPSVDDVDTFVNDERPDAFDRVVDRLLTSPQYALKWARGWLDGARYADSNGYQADQYRTVWPYRDWVIDAMNADMPFDQFTIEQLAGDLLPDATLQQKIATGFHRLTTCNVEAGVDPEENRTNQILDRVNTTATVWLGTTLECAQCHSHKYDPFSQREYYQIFDYFNNTPMEVEGNGVTYEFTGPKMELPLTPKQQAERTRLQTLVKELKSKVDARVAVLTKEQVAWETSARERKKTSPKWQVLEVATFESKGGASHRILDDQSVLLSGETPGKDVYTVTATTKLDGITGFRLEALTDDSLPGKGPGRYAADRPNFVLHEFTVAAKMREKTEPSDVPLHRATADFSQARYDVANAIDGKSETAWAIAPQFHKPHTATFLTVQRLQTQGNATLTFTLDQHYGQGRTIGRLRLSAMTGTPNEPAIPDNIAKIIDVPKQKRTKKQLKALADYHVGLDAEVTRQRAELSKLQKQLDALKPITTLVMVEQEKPRMTHVFKRGSFLDKGEAVTAATPRVLHKSTSKLPNNRLGFARWLADPANPLTPRVAVNRWWAEIFGAGLVRTTEDFGAQGDRPTHPHVLDGLALEFVARGWSMKESHRLIVNSATYQQSSKITDDLRERDPYNTLLSRAPRFRLSAETVRDNALAAAGLLITKMHGPPIYPPQPAGHWRHVGRNAPKFETSEGTDRFRRGIYVIWRRSAPYPSFTNFDAPDRAACVVNRARTNTPLQALTLMNDPVYLEMAVAFAERIATEHSNYTIDEKVRFAIRSCVAREPTAAEVSHLESVYQAELSRFQEDPAAAKTLLGESLSGDVTAEELAAWFYVANILLNLDETITKG